MKTSEALVIGAGPVGLLSALCLDDRDVQVQVIDAQWRRPVRSYACGLHAETLAVLEQVGLLPEVLDMGHRIDRVAVYRGSERVGAVDFGRIRGPFPHALTLRQSDLEDILIDALERRQVQVFWRREVTHLSLRDAVVKVATMQRRMPDIDRTRPAEPRSGEPDTYQASYVIGADGHHSTCRRALGIDMTGSQPPDVFAACEFLADLSGWEHEARVVLMKDSVNAFWPLGPNLGRWTFQVTDRLDEAPSLSSLHRWIQERAPWFEPNPEQLCWGALADFPKRIARRFGNGRIWLAGDSAHSTGPLGFQSLNRGLCEASALAAIIGRSCHGEARRVRPFEQFDLKQQAEWGRLLGTETRVIGGAALSSEEGTRLVPCLPASGDDLHAMLAQLGLSTTPTPAANDHGYPCVASL